MGRARVIPQVVIGTRLTARGTVTATPNVILTTRPEMPSAPPNPALVREVDNARA